MQPHIHTHTHIHTSHTHTHTHVNTHTHTNTHTCIHTHTHTHTHTQTHTLTQTCAHTHTHTHTHVHTHTHTVSNIPTDPLSPSLATSSAMASSTFVSRRRPRWRRLPKQDCISDTVTKDYHCIITVIGRFLTELSNPRTFEPTGIKSALELSV